MMLSIEDILAREPVYGGKIRHTLPGENVSINNLIAVHSTFAADVCGNRFEAQFLLPIEFYMKVEVLAASRGMFFRFMEKDVYGGVCGVISQATIQLYDGEQVLIYTPHNDLVFSFDVTDEHWLKSKETLANEVGINKGFDLIIPYHPSLGYAPPILLAQWVEEGYEKPKSVMDTIAKLPTGEKLALIAGWERNGWVGQGAEMLRLGIAKPEELMLLGSGETQLYDPEEDDDSSSS